MTKLSDLLGARTIDVVFARHTIQVTYDLAARTPERLDEAEVLVVQVVDEVIGLVTAWDIDGDDGAPLPLTREGVRQVPVPVLRRICTEIYGDDGLGEASSNSSAG